MHDDNVFDTCTGIKTIARKVQKTHEEGRKYYEFLINDPLRAFVPKTKLYNNRSFEDYAHEYNMYYKMLEDHKMN